MLIVIVLLLMSFEVYYVIVSLGLFSSIIGNEIVIDFLMGIVIDCMLIYEFGSCSSTVDTDCSCSTECTYCSYLTVPDDI